MPLDILTYNIFLKQQIRCYGCERVGFEFEFSNRLMKNLLVPAQS